MRRRILMCLAVLLLLSGMGAASASDVLAAQSEALDINGWDLTKKIGRAHV